MKFTAKLLAATLAIAGAATAVPAQATVVFAVNPALTSLGMFAPGTYTITASGVIQLIQFRGEFQVGPDGTPVSPVLSPGYSGYCNPSGCTTDINSPANPTGPGGDTIKLGALIGTLTATPTLPSNYFLIGNSTTVTLATAGNIFAVVNDTAYGNNLDSFTAEVSAVRAAVPEPATWAMLMVGFALAGAGLRRRRSAMVTALRPTA